MDIAFITSPDKMNRLKINIFEYFIENNKKIEDITGNNRLYYVHDCNYCNYDDDSQKIEESVELLRKIISGNNYLIIKHTNMHQDIINIVEGGDINKKRVIKSIHDKDDDNNQWYLALPKLISDVEYTKEFIAGIIEKEKEQNTLNEKITFLHKLLVEKEGLKEEYDKYKLEHNLSDLPEFPEVINNEFIERVRDVILNKES